MLTRREALAVPAVAVLQGQSAGEPMALTAGPLSLTFEPSLAFVRYLRFGPHEVLRGIYAAVRDSVWGTVAPKVSNLATEIRAGSFQVTFDVDCQDPDKAIAYRWKGRLTGAASGEIRFTFDGEALSDFERNRIGFCVLHPIAECAGKPCVVEEGGGQITRGTFPLAIAPHQPFFNMKSIAHELPGGARVKVAFEGDLFEMEDHRNWTDGNYKTYCTPLARPWPVKVKKGDRVSQAITVTVQADRAPAIIRPAAVEITIAGQPTGAVPQLGACYTPGAAIPTGLSHVRVEFDGTSVPSLAIPIEAAVHLGDNPEAQLAALARTNAKIARWLIFKNGEKSTKAQWITLARRYLKNAPIASGTNIYFTELNRERPPVDLIDQACYSLNPQVHAFDNTSLVENLEAQGDTLRSARAFLGTKPIAVTPITLRPRFNAEAKVRVMNPPDPRQSTPFARAWTLGSVKYMAENKAASVTYFELAGPGGLAGTPAGRLFEDLLTLQGAAVHAALSSDPLQAVALVAVRGRRRHTFVANLTPRSQVIHCAHTTADGLVPLLPYSVKMYQSEI